MRNNYISEGAMAAALMASVWSPQAHAQAQAQADVTAQAGSDKDYQPIVVTARRRDETLQQTPLAITAISPTQLESKATLNIGDLQGAAPNVLITQQNTGGAAANVSIRGLSFADVDKSFEPTVGIIVDGVFIGTSTGAYLDFFDIASLEVLRGPQGTLFGRNTIGGVINIQRTRPTGVLGGKFEASYGAFNTWSTRAVVNAPIIDGVLAAKLFYFHDQSDGFYRSGITGASRGGNNNENFGASFLLTPGSNFDALLTLEKQVQNFDPVFASISKTGELFCKFAPANECDRNTTTDLYTTFSSPGHAHYSAPAETLEMNLKTGGVKLTSITGYRKSYEDQYSDVDALSADLYYTHRIQPFHQFSQELRAAGKLTNTFDYVVGAYYYNSKYTLTQFTRLFGAPTPASNQLTTGKSQSYAFFGDFDWAFAEKWRLEFGGRWTHDKKQNQLDLGPDSFPNAVYNGSKFTPKVSVDYRPNRDVMVYASWSRGYRSGGFSGRGLTEFSSTLPYGPETVDSYEVGFKTSWFDNHLQFNLAAFDANYKNLQQSTTVPLIGGVGNETVVGNVGSAKIKGIEADLTARIVKGFRVNASLGILDSKFKNFVTTSPDPNNPEKTVTFNYSAVNLIYAPKLTLTVNGEYSQELEFGKWTSTAGLRHISSYDQQISIGQNTVDAAGNVTVLSNDPRVRANPQNLVDLTTTVAWDIGGHEAHVTLYGRNMLNDRGPNAAFTVAGLWSFATAREPRTYGVQVGYKF